MDLEMAFQTLMISMPIKNLISLDLEMNQPSEKIIQIGYVIFNPETFKVLKRQSLIVDPEETLNPFIIELTGITQDMVNGECRGGTGDLRSAYSVLRQDINTYDCFRNPVTWGGGDSLELRKQLNMDDESFVFGRRWIDVKTLYISWAIVNGHKPMGGLAKSMPKLGLKFEGQKHRADDDAYNTMLMYQKLLSFFKKEVTN